MNYPNLRRVVDELQVAPFERRVFDFLFTEKLPEGGTEVQLNVTLDYLLLIPLVEAIGMRLRWCADQTIDCSRDALFNPNAALDVERLIAALAQLMEATFRAELPAKAVNYKLLKKASDEASILADEARAIWLKHHAEDE